MWPAMLVPATYSAGGTPMRVIRHSSVSAPPVETAMSGMLSYGPAPAIVPGSRKDLSGWGFGSQGFVLIGIARRHLPTCRTSVTSPTGTFRNVNVPSTLVAVAVRAPALKRAGHEHASAPVGTPLGKGTKVVAGT